MTPRTLKFVNVWRQTVRFRSRPSYPRERARDMHWIRRWINSIDATIPQNCSPYTTHNRVCTAHTVRICGVCRWHNTMYSGIECFDHVLFRLDPVSKLSPDISSNDLRFSFVLSFRLSGHVHVYFHIPHDRFIYCKLRSDATKIVTASQYHIRYVASIEELVYVEETEA
jgi:hypothetical protein